MKWRRIELNLIAAIKISRVNDYNKRRIIDTALSIYSSLYIRVPTMNLIVMHSQQPKKMLITFCKHPKQRTDSRMIAQTTKPSAIQTQSPRVRVICIHVSTDTESWPIYIQQTCNYRFKRPLGSELARRC